MPDIAQWLRHPRGAARFGLLCVFAAGAVGCLRQKELHTALDADVVAPATFEVDGQRLCFAGANNYYLAFKPKPMVDDVLASAAALGMPVLRIWAYLDAAALDGSVPRADPQSDAAGRKEGVYFQYWDPIQKRPRYNDAANGLQRLDYALAKASERGIKLILVLTNNWYDYGGMDQYLAWYGLAKHHDFYNDDRVKQAYKDWVQQLVTRRNSVSGKLYRDDPTIFAWELANEPRCNGSGAESTGWTKQTIVTWADEMSRYVKSLDANHLVSVGDEGFLDAGGQHWAYRARDGVDHAALTALPAIDFGTYHLYPEHWGAPLSWGTQWIVDHERLARQLDKPTMLEEYGVKVVRDEQGRVLRGLESRLFNYELWNDTLMRRGGSASLAWVLAGLDTISPNAIGQYRDYDGYTVYRGDRSAALLSEIGRHLATQAPACEQNLTPSPRPPSPFARVRHAREHQASSFGWIHSSG